MGLAHFFLEIQLAVFAKRHFQRPFGKDMLALQTFTITLNLQIIAQQKVVFRVVSNHHHVKFQPETNRYDLHVQTSRKTVAVHIQIVRIHYS
jgi:hypothetical protein